MLSAIIRKGISPGIVARCRAQPWQCLAKCQSVLPASGRASARHLMSTNHRIVNRYLISSKVSVSVLPIPKNSLSHDSTALLGRIGNNSIHHLQKHSRRFKSTRADLHPGVLAPTYAARTTKRILQDQRSTLYALLQKGGHHDFHTSRPNQLPIPLLPAALFTLKTPITAIVLRTVSRISLTLLPLSAKRSPKVILTLVMIPPICFALVIFAGLEAAPNTGRWRFLYVNKEEELEMIQEEIPTFMESIKVITDPNDPRVQLVNHILQNLLSSSIEQDGSTLRTGIVERLEERYKEAQSRLKDVQIQKAAAAATAAAVLPVSSGAEGSGEDNTAQSLGSTKAIVSTQRPIPSTVPDPSIDSEEGEDPELAAITFEDQPFQIFVAEDDAINAFSLGPPRLIYINSGLLDWLENDEDLVAAVVAHELAHVIQRHTMETHGRETVMLFLADLFRSALWAVSIPLGPWFNSWVDSTTNDLLHATASGPLHQIIEVEADTVSLTLLALAGYDPMHAVRLWEQWAEKDQRAIEAEDSADVHKWTDWMYDHPPSAERARYLKEAVMPAREMWEKVLKRRKTPIKRFLPLEKRLQAGIDEDGDLTESTVQDVMETMDELLKNQEEEERTSSSFSPWAIYSWWKPDAKVNVGSAEPAQA